MNGMKLRQLILDKGGTIYGLAHLLDTTDTTIRKRFKQGNFRADELEKIKKHFCISKREMLDVMFGGNEEND